jgi:hypothetical protein
MRSRAARLSLLLVVCLAQALATVAQAALYWQDGVRSKTIHVCFVGDALSARPARVEQIMRYLREFEHCANVRFVLAGSCATATTSPNVNDIFAGDIRVILPGVTGTLRGANYTWQGVVPGLGCRMFRNPDGSYNGQNNGGGSWSNGPNEALGNAACAYILKLGDDAGADNVPYLNHTLHEFGHALGLSPEHERTDADKVACPAVGGGASGGFVTPYDRRSVMHYQFTDCGIDGNYGQGGLSPWDQLAVHILYPEDAQVAEFWGTTVIPAGRQLRLRSAWKARGANMPFVASNHSWSMGLLGGPEVTLGTSPDLTLTPPTAGIYRLRYRHRDFLGRTYTYAGLVRVVSAADWRKLSGATVSAIAAMI